VLKNPLRSVEAWEKAIQRVKKLGVCGLDCETTGLDPWVDQICMIQMAIPNYSANPEVDLVHPQGKSVVCGTNSTVYLLNLNRKDIQHYLPGLVSIIEDAKVQVITHNGIFEQKMLRQAWGKRINAKNLFDTMLVSQLVTAGDYVPKSQMAKWSEKHHVKQAEVNKKVVFLNEMDQEIRLQEKVKAIAGQNEKIYYLGHQLRDLALRHLGVVLDKTFQTHDWSGEVSSAMLKYAAYLVLLAERENVLTPDRSSFIFWNDNIEKEDRFLLSTSKDVIKRVESRLPLASPLKSFIQNLLKYRGIKSRIDGVDAYIKRIHPETNKLHTSLKQLNPFGVGRFSASNPNLQQVSHEADIRDLFIAGPGRKLLIADYSAIEMRIMAELSEDKTLLKAFEEKRDVHEFTAANMTEKAMGSVTKEERQAAKAVNFGLIYGISAYGLMVYAENSFGVRMTLEEAEIASKTFFKLYSGVKQWQEFESKQQYENNFEVFHSHSYSLGYFNEKRPSTATFDERLRVFPQEQKRAIKTGRPYVSKVGPVTELYNTPDQGCGASIIKLAMANIYGKLFAKGWDDVLLIMTLHDELVVSAPEDKAEIVKGLLKDAMVNAWKAIIKKTPIEVTTAIGDSWGAK